MLPPFWPVDAAEVAAAAEEEAAVALPAAAEAATEVDAEAAPELKGFDAELDEAPLATTVNCADQVRA